MSNLHVQCLVLAQAFETVWAYYSQSGGQLYAGECREIAAQFLDSVENLAAQDPRITDPVQLTLGEHTNVQEILDQTRAWSKSDSNFPYFDLFQSRFMLFVFTTGLKGLLLRTLGITHFPKMTVSSVEMEHSARWLRWRAHLPRKALLHDPDEIVRKASGSQTIAVIGDIRRSQDLMTYAQDPNQFSQHVVRFISVTRDLIEKHCGFFDKFTGDGFLVYFNESVCALGETDYITCFLNFVKDEVEFSNTLFNEWSRSIRKLPSTRVGLAMGADVGRIDFQDLGNHLVAVGDTIVWAARMAAIASSGELLVNNLLSASLMSITGLSLDERPGRTKAGEDFLARAVSFHTPDDRASA